MLIVMKIREVNNYNTWYFLQYNARACMDDLRRKRHHKWKVYFPRFFVFKELYGWRTRLRQDGLFVARFSLLWCYIRQIRPCSFENDNINPTVNEVIDEFSRETPSELELIATALYVYLQVKDVSRIKTEVIKIKGSKYSGSRIDSAIGRLKATGYIVE